MKIIFTYKHIDQPWGGANNFIRALYGEVRARGVCEVTHSMDSDVDILFMNQLGAGPGGKTIRIREIKSWLKSDGKNRKKLVVRAVNLNLHAHRRGITNLTKGLIEDIRTIRLLNMADAVIFQSSYQKKIFDAFGYSGKNHSVIHNGAAPAFCSHVCFQSGVAPLKLISTGSDRGTKNHHLIAEFSKVRGVEVSYFGAWPKHEHPAKVKLMGKRTHKEIAEAMKTCHFFLFPAVKDMCPNSLVEALAAGLPVIYNPGPGSNGEIAREFGIAMNEKDLVKTIDLAREKYPELYQSLGKHREMYYISRAAESYISVFNQTLNGGS